MEIATSIRNQDFVEQWLLLAAKRPTAAARHAEGMKAWPGAVPAHKPLIEHVEITSGWHKGVRHLNIECCLPDFAVDHC